MLVNFINCFFPVQENWYNAFTTLLCKIQVVRAIGLAIIENGNMYPPMELLLRHAVQYFDLPAQAGVDSESFDYSAESLRRELRRKAHASLILRKTVRRQVGNFA